MEGLCTEAGVSLSNMSVFLPSCVISRRLGNWSGTWRWRRSFSNVLQRFILTWSSEEDVGNM